MTINPTSPTKRNRDRDWIVEASAHGWCLEGDWPYSQKQVVIDTLRRTLGTRLAKLKCSSEIRSRVLNHTPSGVGDVHYNKCDYEAEKRQASMRGAWHSPAS